MLPIYAHDNEFEYPSTHNLTAMNDSVELDFMQIKPKAVMIDISSYYGAFYKLFKSKILLDTGPQLALDSFIVMMESALPDYPESIWSVEDFTTKVMNFIADRYIAYYNGNIPKASGYNMPGAASDISLLCEILDDDLKVDKSRDKMFFDPNMLNVVYDSIKYIIARVINNSEVKEEVLMYSPVGITGSCLDNPINTNLIGTEYSLQTVVIPISKEW